eukprot:SAG11_NODE_766_length_7274_cov_11.526690_4_plen_71_part_00
MQNGRNTTWSSEGREACAAGLVARSRTKTPSAISVTLLVCVSAGTAATRMVAAARSIVPVTAAAGSGVAS